MENQTTTIPTVQPEESASNSNTPTSNNQSGGGSSKIKKILLGILTLWQPVYIFCFIISICLSFLPGGMEKLFSIFIAIFILHVLTIFLSFFLFIYYLVSTLRNEAISSNDRVAWIIGMIFLGPLVMLYYWYKYIWREQDSSQTLSIPKMLGVIFIFFIIDTLIIGVIFAFFLSPFMNNTKFNLGKASYQNIQANADLLSAKSAYVQKNYQDVYAYASKALAESTTDTDKSNAHYWIGLSYYGQGNYDKALFEENTALQLNPKFAAPYATRAGVELTKQNYQEALSDSQKCVDLDPAYPWCYNNKGIALLSLNQYQEGIDNLKKAVALDPNTYVFQDNLSRAEKTNPSTSKTGVTPIIVASPTTTQMSSLPVPIHKPCPTSISNLHPTLSVVYPTAGAVIHKDTHASLKWTITSNDGWDSTCWRMMVYVYTDTGKPVGAITYDAPASENLNAYDWNYNYQLPAQTGSHYMTFTIMSKDNGQPQLRFPDVTSPVFQIQN